MGPVVGFKPIGKVDDLFGIRIPNDDLTIRIWPGNTAPDTGVFYLDFIDTATGKAVNKPPGYILDVIAPAGLASRMVSVEEAWDGKPAARGEERFALLEQLTIKLTRPGHPDFVCVLPCRTRPGELHFERM
ncbi:hypothetical protein C8F01DRAFT_1229307 [Mycena amicta]|nr:hypothetical protein C8F01DRAFT_1229307 [Mycena amicta]